MYTEMDRIRDEGNKIREISRKSDQALIQIAFHNPELAKVVLNILFFRNEKRRLNKRKRVLNGQISAVKEELFYDYKNLIGGEK